MLADLIAELRSEEHGQLIDRGRVIDHLLDLRLAAAGAPAATTEIDRVMAEVPGKTTVETVWWLGVLESLERSVAAEPAI